MLDDQDRIFTNLYGSEPWNLAGRQNGSASLKEKV